MKKLFIDGSKLIHHLDRVQLWQENKLTVPVHVEISPAGGCNQRCILCCVDYLGHQARFISEAVLLDIVNEMKTIGIRSMLLAGEGEPTLNKGIIRMLGRAGELGVSSAINSNGVYFTPELAAEVLPQLQWARFSFQAGDKTRYHAIHRGHAGDFDRAVENISLAAEIKAKKKLDVTLGVQQILLPENMDTIFQTAKMAKSAGVDYYVLKRFSKHPRNGYDVEEDLYKGLEEELVRTEELATQNFKVIIRWNNFTLDSKRLYKNCVGIRFISNILSDGSVYPCSQFFHQKDYCLGNVNQQKLGEIYNSKRAIEITDMIRTSVDVSKCMTYCRHHGTNQFLAGLMNGPKHSEFI